MNSIDKESVRVTLITKNAQRFNSLQYRISAPESKFGALMTSSTWPKDVRIREFFFKQRNNNAVNMDNFLVIQTVTQTVRIR